MSCSENGSRQRGPRAANISLLHAPVIERVDLLTAQPRFFPPLFYCKASIASDRLPSSVSPPFFSSFAFMSAQENAEGTTSIGKDDTTPASSPQSSSADLLKDASSGSAPNSPSMRPASLRTSNDSSEPESPSPEPGANAKKEKKMKKSKSATLKREGNKEDVSESGEKKTLRTSTKVKKKSAEDKQEEGKQPLAHSAEISIKKSQSEQDIKKHAEVRRTPSVEDKKSKEENPLKRTPSTERKEKGEGASGLKRSPSTEDTKEKKGKDEEVKRVPSGEKKKEGELKRVPSDLKKVLTSPLLLLCVLMRFTFAA